MEPSNDEKRQKRLQRNKESARKSRNRKKHYQEFLENKVKNLCQEASTLRQQLYIKSEKIELSENTIEVKKTINKVSEKLASVCNQRKNHIKFIIDEVVEVMIPSHAKLLMVACQNTNVHAPELANHQLKYIRDLQPVIVQEQNKLKEVVNELKKVREELENMLDWASELPEQLLKFLSSDKITELLNSDQS